MTDFLAQDSVASAHLPRASLPPSSGVHGVVVHCGCVFWYCVEYMNTVLALVLVVG